MPKDKKPAVHGSGDAAAAAAPKRTAGDHLPGKGDRVPGWMEATANVTEIVEQATQRLQGEIDALKNDLRKAQLDLAQVERRNRIALSYLVPPRAGRLARFLPGARKLPAWVREQVETLRKSRLFDTDYYMSQNPDVQSAGMDALSHYVLIGGFEGRKPNAVFDSFWYMDRYADVAQSGLNPLYHYLRHGVEERRAVGPLFDTAYYLARNPDVAASKTNPLVHYLRHGMKEGRVAVRGKPLARAPKAPKDSQWMRATPRAARADARVDVIIPVYRGYDDTLACIHSVLESVVSTPFELVVIDDHSPERELSAKLQELAKTGLFTLLVNPQNLGFVETVNRGMALHADRDVILLNSDTVVYNDWLDRLAAQARTDHVGTVTPFSTNATICSYPTTLRDNPEALEIEFDTLDRVAAEVNAGVAIDIPTAVGFCMYITRPCLTAVGLFDTKAFGKGYGEENDFCRRAVALGWRNVLAADVFVRHTGEVSFAETAATGQSQAMKALLAKHPDYTAIVRDYIRRDPAAAARRKIDAARLRAQIRDGAVLHISHNWGGGIDKNVRDMAAMLEADGISSLLLTTVERGKPQIGIRSFVDMNLPNLMGLDILTEGKEIAGIIKAVGVRRIHVHSLAGFPLEATAAIRAIAHTAGLPYDFTVHDYMAFCPRLTFVNGSGRYCGEKGLASCSRCIAVNGTPFGRINATEWRRHFTTLLEGAQNIYAPSQDTCKRVSGYLHGRNVIHRPHLHSARSSRVLAFPWRKGDVLRVMLIGGINDQKGSRLLLAMAEDAARRHLPIEFTIVGHTDRDGAFAALGNVTITGRYQEEDLFSLMAAQGANCVFLSSVSPETYSYVLTAALEAGFPVAAFNLGAQAERLRQIAPETSLLIDEDLVATPPKVTRALLNWIKDITLPGTPPALSDVTYTAESYYGADLTRSIETNAPQD